MCRKLLSIGKKGSIFTIDAILALLVASVMLGSAFVLLQQPMWYGKGDAVVSAYDTLSVLENSGVLFDSVISGSNTAISQFINSMPSHICANLSIYTLFNQNILSSSKSSCKSSDEMAVARAAFVGGNKTTYYAEMRTWYK